MLFEKKMIILSGAGKGVVLIERNGLGVKFALRTFGVRGNLMAGIVTPDRVIVRDLPFTPDPAAVFYVDQIELNNLHFAVFNNELVLYGAIGKRMWPSNLMDILRRHSVRQSTDYVQLAPLKPLAEKPKHLPLPDGTGIPQSRIALYGDDAIAADNFYTGLDIASTVPRLDAFLDGPRLLVEQGPPQEPVGFSVGMSETTACRAETEENMRQNTEVPNSIEGEETIVDEINYDQIITKSETDETGEPVPVSDNFYGDSGAATETAKSEKKDIGDGETPAEHTAWWIRQKNYIKHLSAYSEVELENKVDDDGEKPTEITRSSEYIPWWVRQAEYIKSLSTREITPKITQISKRPQTAIKKIREVTFFERTKPDIDKLFSGAPRDNEIAKLLGGEWVKVAIGNNAVSVGRVDELAICYAVPGSYEKVSPLGENAQWLPRVAENPTGKGFWLIFQNLTTGEIVK